jgi:hypothetical protein
LASRTNTDKPRVTAKTTFEALVLGIPFAVFLYGLLCACPALFAQHFTGKCEIRPEGLPLLRATAGSQVSGFAGDGCFASAKTNTHSKVLYNEACSVDMPLTLHGPLASVRLLVNSKSVEFILDTGSFTVVNSNRISLPRAGRKEARVTVTVFGTRSDDWQPVRIDRFAIGRVTLSGVQVISRDLSFLEATFGREVDGVLGNDFLSFWGKVDIDYRHGRLVLEGLRESH